MSLLQWTDLHCTCVDLENGWMNGIDITSSPVTVHWTIYIRLKSIFAINCMKLDWKRSWGECIEKAQSLHLKRRPSHMLKNLYLLVGRCYPFSKFSSTWKFNYIIMLKWSIYKISRYHWIPAEDQRMGRYTLACLLFALTFNIGLYKDKSIVLDTRVILDSQSKDSNSYSP